jgi:uncharacterized protein YbcC (UPF0753/DUF2309 family)
VENKGSYETFGYAGFFGIAMDYQAIDTTVARKSCPPIVHSAYQVSDQAVGTKEADLVAYKIKKEHHLFRSYFLNRMKNMLPSAFGYVEGSGLFYGFALIAKTLLPQYIFPLKEKKSLESISEPHITHQCDGVATALGVSQKAAIVKSAFDLLGWKDFAPLVVFVGHGSHTANNAFGSSLDCGACAASPGRHNARMLAQMANDQGVQQLLREEYQIELEATYFVGAEHNTTTDAILLFDTGAPETHLKALQQLKSDLFKTQNTATQERLGVAKNSVTLANKNATNWSETRPEWGLAKNAALIIGPRALSKNKNLDGRCFLNSYDWRTDATAKALEAIMQGPMTVTQWINNHYYFSTVDNKVFGGGSKITHNITGKFGVLQGNGGDIKMGLPLQSLQESDEKGYHQPLRLSVFIEAPVSRVAGILERNSSLKELLDNEWIYLIVMDPTQQSKIVHYRTGMQWVDEKPKRNPDVTIFETA